MVRKFICFFALKRNFRTNPFRDGTSATNRDKPLHFWQDERDFERTRADGRADHRPHGRRHSVLDTWRGGSRAVPPSSTLRQPEQRLVRKGGRGAGEFLHGNSDELFANGELSVAQRRRPCHKTVQVAGVTNTGSAGPDHANGGPPGTGGKTLWAGAASASHHHR